MRLEGWHIVIIVVLALVLFAAPKLPSMARSIGQSMRIFKSEVREMKKDGSSEAASGEPRWKAKWSATRSRTARTAGTPTSRRTTAFDEWCK